MELLKKLQNAKMAYYEACEDHYEAWHNKGYYIPSEEDNELLEWDPEGKTEEEISQIISQMEKEVEEIYDALY